jgi:hypothetical protein
VWSCLRRHSRTQSVLGRPPHDERPLISPSGANVNVESEVCTSLNSLAPSHRAYHGCESNGASHHSGVSTPDGMCLGCTERGGAA